MLLSRGQNSPYCSYLRQHSSLYSYTIPVSKLAFLSMSHPLTAKQAVTMPLLLKQMSESKGQVGPIFQILAKYPLWNISLISLRQCLKCDQPKVNAASKLCPEHSSRATGKHLPQQGDIKQPPKDIGVRDRKRPVSFFVLQVFLLDSLLPSPLSLCFLPGLQNVCVLVLASLGRCFDSKFGHRLRVQS